jgi:hypothetical protein
MLLGDQLHSYNLVNKHLSICRYNLHSRRTTKVLNVIFTAAVDAMFSQPLSALYSYIGACSLNLSYMRFLHRRLYSHLYKVYLQNIGLDYLWNCNEYN